MELLRVAAATVNQTPMDWDGNEARIRQKLEEAALAEVDVVCFPELCLTGYNCEDMFFSLHLTRMAERARRQQHAIDPVPNVDLVFRRFDMNVTGALVECILQQPVNDIDDMLVVGVRVFEFTQLQHLLKMTTTASSH